ncbi:MAG TPA: hypothetical protein ENK24_06755 [Anaerolineae bacterium]|nr:hypothetical protein [Anaerolineae bacterium]
MASAITKIAQTRPQDPLAAVEQALRRPPERPGNGRAGGNLLDGLRELGIREPTRGNLAALAHTAQPGYLDAWIDWFAGQSEFGVGWLVRQIEAGDWPPEAAEDWPPNGTQLPLLAEIPASLSPAERLWRDSVTMLRGQYPAAVQHLGGSKARLDGDVLRVAVRSGLSAEWLKNRLQQVIERVVQQAAMGAEQNIAKVEFETGEEA